MKKKKKILSHNAPTIEAKPKIGKSQNYTNYQDKGLVLTRESSSAESVKIVYNGLLIHKGASDIYVHAGVGEQWDNIQDIKMTKTLTGEFVETLLVGEKTMINICFRNDNNDWDNNDTHNYSYNLD